MKVIIIRKIAFDPSNLSIRLIEVSMSLGGQMLDGLTLDQMRMLLAVVDEGSFTKAAARVQRAQSAVSHAIATMEFQLDLTLFDRSTRQPRLTAEGAAIVADARAVIDRVNGLKTRAASLRDGVEPQLGFAISLLVPPEILNATLIDFVRDFPQTELDLFVQEASGPLNMVEDGRADIGIVGAFNLRGVLSNVARIPIGQIEIVSVVAPQHCLAELGRVISPSDLRDERQLTSANARGEGTADPLSLGVWPIADQSLRRSMLLSGLGWGIVPKHLVARDLEDGSLIQIDLEVLKGEASSETLIAVYREDRPLGKAGEWLIATLTDRMGTAR